MKIYVDIDNTITKTNGLDYQNAIPIYSKIKIINELYDNGHTITYWTGRGCKSGIDYFDLTKKQLEKWGVKYHQLILGQKPDFDLLIDDKAINKITKKLLNG